jgi:hypothetical protein
MRISMPAPDSECHVFERQSDDLVVQCQALAGRGGNDITWPATVRHVSVEQIGLVLVRRFEPNTGLSLFLPDARSDSVSNVFARVARVEPCAGRWVLDCTFVTPLTQERLDAFLQAAKGPPTLFPEPQPGLLAGIIIEKAVVLGALFQVRYGNADPIRRPVTRLHVNGSWPLATGQAVRVWVGTGPANESAALVRVNGCYKQGGGWLVDCYFLGAPPAILLDQLRTGIVI